MAASRFNSPRPLSKRIEPHSEKSVNPGDLITLVFAGGGGIVKLAGLGPLESIGEDEMRSKSMLPLSSAQRVKHHWLSHNVAFNEGVSADFLADFERRFGVVLPHDMRDYFLAVNGMQEDVTDDEMLRFWPLEEVKPLPSGAPGYATADYIDTPESIFLFADYSLWAHAYAIRLSASELSKNEIFIIGGDYPILLFQSFSELVESYLADKRLMFARQNEFYYRN